MRKKRYLLKCHHKEEKDTKVYATIELKEEKFKVNYEIIGNLSSYIFPKQTQQKRVNELWKKSCFELFVANHSSAEYYEVNTSPSTEWNVYHFRSYKEKMTESDVFSEPTIKSYQSDKEYNFSFEMTFKENTFEEKLDFNLAVILLDIKGVRYFYATNRREESPDFHDRKYYI